MQPRAALVLRLFLATLAAGAAFGACNNQGEGQVCDVNAGDNGNDDCQSGLECVQAPGALGTPNPYRCCPTDLQQQATVTVCMQGASTIDASSAPPGADAQTQTAADTGAVGDGSAPGTADAAFDAAEVSSPVTEASTEAAPTADAGGE